MRNAFAFAGVIALVLASGCSKDPQCGDCVCTADPVGGECLSNVDCAEPTSVCDPARGQCVQCLVLADCGFRAGTVCSAGACVCPGGETWCGPDLCVDTATSSEHCGACGRACFGSCAAGACADAWVPVAIAGAPAPRARHVAVWTGSSMVVWGGTLSASASGVTHTGGVYDPAENRWTETSIVGAPSARQEATAVWTGTEMLVWGGRDAAGLRGDGAAFDPATNTWTPMAVANAPSPRIQHSVVWTGSAMLVYGGSDGVQQLGSGAAYDPARDEWAPILATPESRAQHSAVWDPAGGVMLVYGGIGDAGPDIDVRFPSGGTGGGRAFAPATGGWSSITLAGQPSSRSEHTAVWTDDGMVVFGGNDGGSPLGSGALYSYVDLSWTQLPPPAPSARRGHTAVLLDAPGLMLVWGGIGPAGAIDEGGALRMSTLAWEGVPTALAARSGHAAVSTGSSMIVWGGLGADGAPLGDGGIYTP